MTEVTKKTKVRKYDKWLRVELTEKDLLETGEKLGRRQADLGALEDSFKCVKEQFKNDITKAETDINKYGRLLRDKHEMKDVKVEQTFDYDNDLVTLVRMDTGEVVESRELNADELQTSMDFDSGEAEEVTTVETEEEADTTEEG